MIEQLKSLDAQFLLWVNENNSSFLDVIMWQFSKILPTILLVLIIAFFLYRRIHLRYAATYLLGCAFVFVIADGSSNAVKHSVKRYRPTHNIVLKEKIHKVKNYEGGKYGFFSGHSANTFGLTFFTFLFATIIQTKWRRIFFFYPIIVVYSRMYLGVHYPSDILVGIVVGFIAALIVNYVVRNYFLKGTVNAKAK